jgi:hypothetical protein
MRKERGREKWKLFNGDKRKEIKVVLRSKLKSKWYKKGETRKKKLNVTEVKSKDIKIKKKRK